MSIDNMPLDLKVACIFTQKSWCHVATSVIETSGMLSCFFVFQCCFCRCLYVHVLNMLYMPVCIM